jgi:hypothetical protein
LKNPGVVRLCKKSKDTVLPESTNYRYSGKPKG